MHIYSGKVFMGVCGVPAKRTDLHGAELFVGDIVYTFKDNYMPDTLTAIVSSQQKIFPMGIRDAWLLEDGGWRCVKLKDHSEAIHGERWFDWGFNYILEDKKEVI